VPPPNPTRSLRPKSPVTIPVSTDAWCVSAIQRASSLYRASPAMSVVSTTSAGTTASAGSSSSPNTCEAHWASLAPANGSGQALRHAARMNDVDKIEALLAAGCGIDSYDEAFERTALHFAAQLGCVRAVDLLLRRGADPEACDISLSRPLHLAAERGQTEVVRMLCEFEASTVATTSNGSVALHLACHNNHVECAQLLSSAMAERGYLGGKGYDEFLNHYRKSPLDVARERGHSKIVALLEVVVPHRVIDLSDVSAAGPDMWRQGAASGSCWEGLLGTG